MLRGVMSASAITASLRETEPLHPRVALGHDAADACLKGGILKGALHEVFAAEAGCETSASGFAMALAIRTASQNLQTNPQSNNAQNNTAQHKQLLWIRHDFSALEFGELSATGLLELGLDPARAG